MNTDDFDRILLSERQIETSSSFVREAMTRIEAEGSLDRGIPFPWILFTLLALGVALVSFFAFPAELRTIHSLCDRVGKWIVSPSDMVLRNALLSGFASVAGTLLLAWFSLRLAVSR